MTKDPRAFIRLHNGMPDHPKIEGLSDAAFRALVSLWCWCSKHLTDGHVTPASWAKRAGDAGPELIAAGLAHETSDGFMMHDYLEHQSSREEVEQVRLKRREAGRRGGLAKARKATKPVALATAPAKASAVASATAGAKQGLKQTPSKSVPEVEVDIDPASYEAGNYSSSDAAASDGGDFPPDVHRLTNLLAELVRANGHKANPTKQWLTACDRLMRLDGYTPEQVEWVMRWATTDEFWAANIRSMPTLREKFSQLAHRARQEHAQAKGRRAPAQDVADILALGERMQAQLEGRAS